MFVYMYVCLTLAVMLWMVTSIFTSTLWWLILEGVQGYKMYQLYNYHKKYKEGGRDSGIHKES